MSNTKHLTDLQQKFVWHLRDILENPGRTENKNVKNHVKEACIRAGYADADRNWWNVSRNMRDVIIDITKDVLSEAGPKAAATLVSIMNGDDDGQGSARDRISAATNVLDRGVGVVKVEKVEVSAPPGVVLLPAKKQQQELPED